MAEASYRAWNRALSDRFLQRARHTPLYLYTDRGVIEEVAPQVGIPADTAMRDFVGTVTSVLTGKEPFRRWADESARLVKPGGTPAYVAVLCFLVLAGVEQERVNFNYYPELNELMGRDAKAGPPPGFERDIPLMFNRFNLWLEGEGSVHGTPTAKPPAHYPYVGWPLSQALVRPADRMCVQRHLFGSLNLRPGERLGGGPSCSGGGAETSTCR